MSDTDYERGRRDMLHEVYATIEDLKMCEIPGCGLAARTGSARWCEKHYMRNRRHGHPLKRHERHDRAANVTSHGYRVLTKRDHPLANSAGRVYEHRLVLYAVIGPGAHLCHWCQEAVVTWGVNLEVDHIDGNGMNNTPANLAPCCHACNAWRTKLRNTNGATT